MVPHGLLRTWSLVLRSTLVPKMLGPNCSRYSYPCIPNPDALNFVYLTLTKILSTCSFCIIWLSEDRWGQLEDPFALQGREYWPALISLKSSECVDTRRSPKINLYRTSHSNSVIAWYLCIVAAAESTLQSLTTAGATKWDLLFPRCPEAAFFSKTQYCASFINTGLNTGCVDGGYCQC